eukprot:6718880-Alexandrium_andersonii.AAC.1
MLVCCTHQKRCHHIWRPRCTNHLSLFATSIVDVRARACKRHRSLAGPGMPGLQALLKHKPAERLQLLVKDFNGDLSGLGEDMKATALLVHQHATPGIVLCRLA